LAAESPGHLLPLSIVVAMILLFVLFGLLVPLTLICGLREARQFRGDLRPAAAVSASEKRGLRLLREWLSPAQLACYEQHGYFEVVGSDSGRVYRIHHGYQANIEQLDGVGEPVCRWCFLPEGNLVAGDVMLAQKVALEASESAALAVANRFTLQNMASQRLLTTRRGQETRGSTPQMARTGQPE
jgi:hypothetical protein